MTEDEARAKRAERLITGIAQASAGATVDRGDFSQCLEECGACWGWHECTLTRGHDGAHQCELHYQSCCTDCSESWTDPCGSSIPQGYPGVREVMA